MKKNLLLLLCALSLAACSHQTKRGAINLGHQPTSVTLVSGDNNDVDLMANHVSPGSIIRVTPASGGSTLTGIVSSEFDDGDMFVLRNDSATDNVTLANSRTSATANQFLLSSAGDVVLPPRSSVWIEVDSTAGKWVQGPGHINSPTFNGTISTANAQIGVGQETKTSGALSTQKKTLMSITGAQAYTLADCTVLGQRKIIEVTVAASGPVGTLTLTTTFNSEPTTHVFNAVGQTLELECLTGNAWHIVGKKRAGQVAVTVGTTVLTGYDMQATYALTVAATVHSTGNKGIPNCNVAGERIHVNTPSATSTPLGDINITGLTIATNAAATSLSAINATTVQADYVCDGSNWQNTSLTTATYSMLEEFLEEFASAA